MYAKPERVKKILVESGLSCISPESCLPEAGRHHFVFSLGTQPDISLPPLQLGSAPGQSSSQWDVSDPSSPGH